MAGMAGSGGDCWVRGEEKPWIYSHPINEELWLHMQFRSFVLEGMRI